MKREEVEKFITELVMPILKDTDLTLVDVEYVREKDWYLRIFIDKPEGIEIDDCQFVSEKLAEVLEKIRILQGITVRRWMFSSFHRLTAIKN